MLLIAISILIYNPLYTLSSTDIYENISTLSLGWTMGSWSIMGLRRVTSWDQSFLYNEWDLSRSYYSRCDKKGDCSAPEIRIISSFGSYLVRVGGAWFHHSLYYSTPMFHSLSLVNFVPTMSLKTSYHPPLSCLAQVPASTHSPTPDVPDMGLNYSQPTTIAAL